MADLNKIVEDLSSLTLLEAAELKKMLEAKWGVSAAAAQHSAAAADTDRAREQQEADALRDAADDNREQATNLLGEERKNA